MSVKFQTILFTASGAELRVLAEAFDGMAEDVQGQMAQTANDPALSDAYAITHAFLIKYAEVVRGYLAVDGWTVDQAVAEIRKRVPDGSQSVGDVLREVLHGAEVST